jgi:hypothetical protein
MIAFSPGDGKIEGLGSSFYSFIIQHVKGTASVLAHLSAKFTCTQDVSFLTTSLLADSVGAGIKPYNFHAKKKPW